MEKDKQNLYVFGYGLALLIPYFVGVKAMHLEPSKGVLFLFLAIFAAILFVVTKISKLQPKMNLWILVVQAYAWKLALTHSGVISYALLVVSTVVLLISIGDVKRLQPAYNVWMKVAHFIGGTITVILLSTIFYLVFGVIGIILRILKKDYLDRKIEYNKKSYWIKRDLSVFDRESCTRQF